MCVCVKLVVIRYVSRSVNLFMNRSPDRPTNHLVKLKVYRPMSVNESINQPTTRQTDRQIQTKRVPRGIELIDVRDAVPVLVLERVLLVGLRHEEEVLWLGFCVGCVGGEVNSSISPSSRSVGRSVGRSVNQQPNPLNDKRTFHPSQYTTHVP